MNPWRPILRRGTMLWIVPTASTFASSWRVYVELKFTSQHHLGTFLGNQDYKVLALVARASAIEGSPHARNVQWILHVEAVLNDTLREMQARYLYFLTCTSWFCLSHCHDPGNQAETLRFIHNTTHEAFTRLTRKPCMMQTGSDDLNIPSSVPPTIS